VYRRSGRLHIYQLPKDIRDNTVRGILNIASGRPLARPYTLGAPTGRYIAPAGLGCMQRYIGDCGIRQLILARTRLLPVQT
jgi:hypothetical protein